LKAKHREVKIMQVKKIKASCQDISVEQNDRGENRENYRIVNLHIKNTETTK